MEAPDNVRIRGIGSYLNTRIAYRLYYLIAIFITIKEITNTSKIGGEN